MENRNWYVFYTRPRAENRAFAVLSHKYDECFLPKRSEIRQWHDRKKKLEIPLFPSYIFVKISASEIYNIVATQYIVKAVMFDKSFAFIEDKEVDQISQLLKLNTGVTVSNHLFIGDEVEIIAGPLEGIKGILSEQKNQSKFVINLPAISLSLTVEMNSSFLRKLSPPLSCHSL